MAFVTAETPEESETCDTDVGGHMCWAGAGNIEIRTSSRVAYWASFVDDIESAAERLPFTSYEAENMLCHRLYTTLSRQ